VDFVQHFGHRFEDTKVAARRGLANKGLILVPAGLSRQLLRAWAKNHTAKLIAQARYFLGIVGGPETVDQIEQIFALLLASRRVSSQQELVERSTVDV
jgi:hypothetical protein